MLTFGRNKPTWPEELEYLVLFFITIGKKKRNPLGLNSFCLVFLHDLRTRKLLVLGCVHGTQSFDFVVCCAVSWTNVKGFLDRVPDEKTKNSSK